MTETTMFIEGDFIEDVNGIIFDVKGFEHPSTRVIAFPRYIPHKEGNRVRKTDNRRYVKIYDLDKRYDYLRECLRDYIIYDSVFDMELCEVPKDNIVKHYKPDLKLKELLHNVEKLDKVEYLALKLASTISYEANVPLEKLGISGSIMVGLHKDDSDIDIVVYGTRESFKVADVLKHLFEKGVLSSFSEEQYRNLYVFRKAYETMDFKTFIRHERRKIFQGTFQGREFFIRFIRDLKDHKPYGYYRYRNIGSATIRAKVVDDDYAIFTPVKYTIDCMKIIESKTKYPIKTKELIEVVSFRGRFCQQAFKGENVIIRGKVEAVLRNNEISHYRIVIGGSPKDYMVCEDFLK